MLFMAVTRKLDHPRAGRTPPNKIIGSSRSCSCEDDARSVSGDVALSHPAGQRGLNSARRVIGPECHQKLSAMPGMRVLIRVVKLEKRATLIPTSR